MWETIRGYLTFTRKERYGVLFLLILVSILFMLPYFFKPAAGDPDPAAYETIKDEIRKFESRTGNSPIGTDHHHRNGQQSDNENADEPADKAIPRTAELFYFDPNRNNAADWQRLGLTQKLTKTILHYIQKGGRFHKAEDLQKIYGLSPSCYERLLPYVHIQKRGEFLKGGSGVSTDFSNPLKTGSRADTLFRQHTMKTHAGAGSGYIPKKFVLTDINQADSSGWSALPGIGIKLASRIIRFREKLGGFYEVEQVGETYGLPDSTFQKIKPYLRMNPVSLRTINLSQATKEELQSHPYIRWQIAKAIIDYRGQHTNFRSIDELMQLAVMDSFKFQKLRPYLVVR